MGGFKSSDRVRRLIAHPMGNCEDNWGATVELPTVRILDAEPSLTDLS